MTVRERFFRRAVRRACGSSREPGCGKKSFENAFLHHRKLIEILAPHDLERVLQRCLGGDGVHLIQGAHRVRQRRVRPARPVDFLDFVRRDQARHVAVLQNHKTAPAGLEKLLVDEMLDVQITIQRGSIGGHEIGGGYALHGAGEADRKIALGGGLQQEPADKRDPETPDACAVEELKNAGDD